MECITGEGGGEMYKFEPRLEACELSKTVPDDPQRRNDFNTDFGMVRNSLGQSGDKMSRGTAGFSRGASSKSKDDPKNFRIS